MVKPCENNWNIYDLTVFGDYHFIRGLVHVFIV